MNRIRQVQELNKRELDAGVSLAASWHNDYRDTAFIYVGGLPLELSEGDVITIFSQYGEPTFINLVRDRETGKSKGFCFLKYEDQRSTDLAVDNLSGAKVMGRLLSVDHTRYKKRDDEDIFDNTNGIGAEANVEDEDPEEGRRRDRKHRRRRSASEEEERPLLKEERELMELRRNHDDDDPMKEYLVKEKEEEVAAALKEYERSKRKQKKEEGRHEKHRHRSRREGREEPESAAAKDVADSRRRHRSRSRSPRREREGTQDGHERSRRNRDRS